MRPLEIVFLLANVPLLTWCLFGRDLPPWARALPVGAALLVLLQVAVEGARWHLAPAYAVTLGVFFACAWPRGVGLGPLAAVLCLGLLGVSAAVATLLPVFRLPTPTGPYPVGTVTIHLVDASREEQGGERRGAPRELMIQVWYPAEHAGPGQVYRPLAETEFKKSHLALVRTNAATGVPLAHARDRYPVVLFSPSWTGRRDQNTVQVEELASHGFLVIGIDHPFGTACTVFPDGRVAETELGEWMDFSSDESFRACVRAAEVQLQIRAADVRFVLDELERFDRADANDLLAGRLDLSRVGMFGHSFGGSVAAEVCLTDPRFKAGVDLDGVYFGGPKSKAIGKPFMVFSEDTPVPTPAQVAAATGRSRRELTLYAEDDVAIRRGLSESGGYFLTLRGTRHMNYCDSPLYSPLRRLTRAGPIRPERAMEIINAYVLAFFRANLLGEDASLLGMLPSPYPEVEFERFVRQENGRST
jgi:pimeloyl-ACP methyl ester carboxylesterase